jgi:hypothetical protein
VLKGKANRGISLRLGLQNNTTDDPVSALIIAAMVIAACSGGTDDVSPTATAGDGPAPTATSAPATPTPAPSTATPTTAAPTVGTIDVRVTDQANGEITAIVITASDLKVNQASGESDGAWLTIVEGEHTFDLLQVVGKEQSLGLTELAPGTYNQIRMEIQSVVITRDGEEIEGEVPSSVLRIVRPFDVVAGEATILTFDFNADRSVVSAGQKLILKPVVKLLVRKGGEDFVPEPFEPDPTATPIPAATATPTPVPTPTPTATPSPTPTPAPAEFVLQIVEPVSLETITSSETITITGRSRADAAITVNDQFATPDLDGIFTTDVTLALGANIIEVVASISTGEELSQVLTIIYIP